MTKKFLKTENLDQEIKLPRPRKNKVISTRSKYAAEMNDVEYCRTFIDSLPKADLKKLREQIETIIANRKPSWWKCNKCGEVRRRAWDAVETSCFHCNQYSKKAGGWLERMSDSEVKKHLKETAEKNKEERERNLKGELARANRFRREEGKEELTLEELKAQKKRYWSKIIPKN